MLFFLRNCGKIVKYEEWAVSGVKRAEELIEESKSKTE